MKIKFLGFEGEFDRDDAYIVLPLILFLATLFLTPFNKGVLIAIASAYYLLYFFWPKFIGFVKHRCPKCKSRNLVLLGLQNYKGDAPYYWYVCHKCNTELVELNSGLIDPNATQPKNKTEPSNSSDDIPF